MPAHPQPADTGTTDAGEQSVPGLLSEELGAELIAFRRDLHMHPELGHQEFRTTAAIKARLEQAGLEPRLLSGGTGLVCDVGLPAGETTGAAGAPLTGPFVPDSRAGAPAGGMLALRADIDALPIPDTKTVSYRSTVPDRAHACGHDVHTAVVLGAGLVLAELARQGRLPRPVRLLFQPAEEVLPGGASDVVEEGVLEGVGRILAVHCDPRVEVGRIGLRTGAITSACDRLEVELDGPGGHTARPHLTTDMVTAAARVALDVPALLARRVDARSGLAVTWGRMETGHACNVIPQHAELSGTVRCLDIDAWRAAPDLVHAAIDEVAGLHRAKSQINYVRGVPPVVNEAESVKLLEQAMTERRGADAVESTEQSLGGEDFSWYLEKVPGAMARLGVRPGGEAAAAGATGFGGEGPTRRDLHRGDFDVDEQAIRVGVELFTAAALLDGHHG
ncbi:amidohydrolase [Streptomyces sp. NPDC059740]|uniref:amidohydrolase n=1 Tax=Streptomyces sp. NPDC059740 TaxID=3346926 RepID=UPI00364767A9